MNDLEQEIITAIAEEGKIDRSEISMDSNLYDLGIDSLSSLEILVALEERYDISIPEEELKDTSNVREIVRIISKMLKRKGGKIMKGEKLFKWFFLVAGLYDFILGALFFLFYVRIYNYLGITLPNHPEYVQSPAIFIVILGIMLFYVFKDMYKNIDMVKIAALSKFAYSGLAFYHYKFTGLPNIFMIFAWCDLVFLVLFIMFLVNVKKSGKLAENK